MYGRRVGATCVAGRLSRRRGGGDALILGVRNGFEHDVGHLWAPSAPIRTMQEWKAYVDASDVVGRSRGRPVLMYCTGGVRCEKASAYLRSRGVGDVQQLDGGIHRFLEAFPDGVDAASV